MQANEPSARASARRLALVYAAHLALAALFTIWHGFAGDALVEGQLARAWPMRAFAALSILLGVAALAWIAIVTLREWRDTRLAALFVLLVASLWVRARPIAWVDVAYATSAVLASAWYFARVRRARSQAR